MPILRAHTGVRGETRIEVFFDLVFAFAVTQLSHLLLDHTSVERAVQTVLLLVRSAPVYRTLEESLIAKGHRTGSDLPVRPCGPLEPLNPLETK